jgi:hypothetical protein
MDFLGSKEHLPRLLFLLLLTQMYMICRSFVIETEEDNYGSMHDIQISMLKYNSEMESQQQVFN